MKEPDRFTGREADDVGYAEWFRIDTGPWVTVPSKHAVSGFPTDRSVRFSIGKCSVPGCTFTVKRQIRRAVSNAMEQHADEHIRTLTGKIGVGNPDTLPDPSDAEPIRPGERRKKIMKQDDEPAPF